MMFFIILYPISCDLIVHDFFYYYRYESTHCIQYFFVFLYSGDTLMGVVIF